MFWKRNKRWEAQMSPQSYSAYSWKLVSFTKLSQFHPATTFLLYFWVWLFLKKISYINENTTYMSFFVEVISLCITPLRSIHVVNCKRQDPCFLMDESCSIVYVVHLVIKSCPALCDAPWIVAWQAPLSMGILQPRILKWIATPSSRGSSQPRNWTQFCIAGRFFTLWAAREAHCICMPIIPYPFICWCDT